ncbi:hypothetical protein [Microbacterium aurantiacum]|uniref:hypothetical protein n=1 Tax=Microbacterium aurantiacum TaxID=162393 RepID=UPI001F15C421|nr:hypothetical protein [Microbacterium aurantiacum]
MVELNGSDDVEASVSTDGTVRVDIDGSGDVTGRAQRRIVRRVATFVRMRGVRGRRRLRRVVDEGRLMVDVKLDRSIQIR